jgi:hypothetical protein
MPDATATATLRPPGAVPPPPRGVPPTPRSFELLDELPELTPTALETPIPSFTAQASPASAGKTGTELPTQPSAAPTPLPTPGSFDVTSDLDALRSFRNRPTEPPTRPRSYPAAPSSTPPLPPLRPSSVVPRHYSVLLFALGTLAGVLAVTVVVLLMARKSEPQPSHQPMARTAAEPPRPPPPPKTPACEVISAPASLSRSILFNVPIAVASLADPPRVAVGYAESATSAAGLLFELPALELKSSFTKKSERPLRGVVPISSQREMTFVLDVDQERLEFTRTIDARPPFTIGFTNGNLTRVAGNNPPEVIWPKAGSESITDIRVATFPGIGHALTFRRGGQSGSVLLGWLSKNGKANSELAKISAPSGLSGTPTVAQNGTALLVAYAWRPNLDVYWSIQLAVTTPGAIPTKTTEFSIPPGGPGAEAISPAATGLPGGRWLLQWTEGSTGARQVRAQVLGTDLRPIGRALTLSRRDQNAGQGALGSSGELALALFLVAKGRGHELWGASLKCP